MPVDLGTSKIAIIGLGYVGLPLAIALAKHFPSVGFDISQDRIDELDRGYDRTDEIDEQRLLTSTLSLTSSIEDCQGADIFIVTVPTPVDGTNTPDLSPLRSACAALGPVLKQGSIVVFESTVYPGVTEDICGPALEESSGMRVGQDFFLGYSPERINPGDREHTVDRITKVIAGENDEVTETLAALYGAVTTGGVFRAASIKAAEAAKVIENAQRDINIAFINEITMIFQKMDLSVYDVLAAAETKWNFLNFNPGLVGGHCIGVDPFYLAHRAQELGHTPDVILAGRKINDGMGQFVADRVNRLVPRGGKILVLGLTFKENVPDLRNSKVVDVVRGLEAHGHEVTVHDPLADPGEARKYYGVKIKRRLADILPSMTTSGAGSQDRRNAHPSAHAYDAVLLAVSHDVYAGMTAREIEDLISAEGLVADVKGAWRALEFSPKIKRWQL